VLVRWRLIPRLVSAYRVVIPDLPGHGESESGDSPMEPTWIENLLEEVAGLTWQEPSVTPVPSR
jgi:pimeloyl-ACP methyl ester carboxylesterase